MSHMHEISGSLERFTIEDRAGDQLILRFEPACEMVSFSAYERGEHTVIDVPRVDIPALIRFLEICK